MVVDASALVAIVMAEPEMEQFKLLISDADRVIVPPSCYLETVMVLRSRSAGREIVDELLKRSDAEILPCDDRQARLAADAFERYGRGSGHPARLNFGDCLAYAAAVANRAPLLFKGEDFAHTDVASAV